MECVFGMLMQQWRILWTATRFSIAKIKSLVAACTKLNNNFCINTNNENENNSILDLSSDLLHIATNISGFVVVEPEQETNDKRCKDVIGGSDHFDDVTNSNYCHCYEHVQSLPCQLLHDHVLRSHMKRPNTRMIK